MIFIGFRIQEQGARIKEQESRNKEQELKGKELGTRIKDQKPFAYALFLVPCSSILAPDYQ